MITLDFDKHIARLTLARADAANALSGAMLRQLGEALDTVRASPVQALCISGVGKHFCAGADIEWMRESAANSAAQNKQEAQILADVLHALHTLPQPTVAVVQGACYGGGGGLAAAVDVCLAAENAKFCFSEVRLGLIPATISPYIVAAIGERQARRYFLDGSVFSAATAAQIGLVHTVVAESALAAAAEEQLAQLIAGGSCAQQSIKSLLTRIRHRAIDAKLRAETAALLAECRAADEAKEGVAAFLQKRPPQWRREK